MNGQTVLVKDLPLPVANADLQLLMLRTLVLTLSFLVLHQVSSGSESGCGTPACEN
jgi:hypothetical protein